ncbi:MAG: hypothetical protein QXH39_00060 [Conexivisphaerales archaeon]
MNDREIVEIREKARKLMAGIFENFYNRRSVSAKIGSRKKAMKIQVEDYQQEKLLMESFNANVGNEGRLFSILIQDSLEFQGQFPMKTIYEDVEIEGISALRSMTLWGRSNLENYIKSTVPGIGGLDVGFVQGRRTAIISWAIEFGYGRAANIIEPIGRSIDQVFWITGSRPYRHTSIGQALKFLKTGTLIMKLPSIFGNGINYEDKAEISRIAENMPVLIDITYSEIGIKGKFSDMPEVSGKSIMVYGLPGTVGYPWETAAIIGEKDTVEKTLKRSFSIFGVMPSAFPAPTEDISLAINVLRQRVEELRNSNLKSLNVPDYGPFAILDKRNDRLPKWVKAVDGSYYGNFNSFYVVNLLK